jgi:hypothetical protein
MCHIVMKSYLTEQIKIEGSAEAESSQNFTCVCVCVCVCVGESLYVTATVNEVCNNRKWKL